MQVRDAATAPGESRGTREAPNSRSNGGPRSFSRRFGDRVSRAIGLFGALLLCLLWGGVGWVISEDHRQTVAEAQKDTSNLARAFDEHMAAVLGGLDHLVQMVRLQYAREAQLLHLPRLMQQIAVPRCVLQVGIIDERGRLAQSSLPFTPTDLSDREHFVVHRDTGADELFISKPVVGRVSGRLSLQLSRRITGADGRFAGVVVVSLDPRYFAEFYHELDMRANGLIAVVGLDGVVRACRTGAGSACGRNVGSLALPGDHAASRHGSFFSGGAPDDVPRYVSYRAMQRYPLAVLVGDAEADMLADFHVRRRILLIAALAVTVMLVAAAAGLMQMAARQARSATEAMNSRARLFAFMDGVPDAGWMKDRDGRFVAVNRAFAGSVGMDPKRIVGRTDLDVFDEAIARRNRGDDERVMRSGRMRRFESAVDDGGRTKWMETIKVPVLDVTGAVSGTCGVSRDVTERRQAEAALREMNRVLEQRAAELTQVNRELDAYSYTVSHDLQAPLRHISGFTRLVRERLAAHPDPYVQQMFARIAEATGRMGAMIDGLLTFSRSGRTALRMARVPLEAIVREAIQEAAAGAEGRDIEWRVGPLPVLYGDRDLLRLALSNLLDNAVKYTRQRALAVIEVGATVDTGDWAAVYIRDNGAGFDAKDASRLFGVFERLHDGREFEGNGIGLATVKRIMERHGGRVWAQGERGAGATFYVAMRCDAGHAGRETPDRDVTAGA